MISNINQKHIHIFQQIRIPTQRSQIFSTSQHPMMQYQRILFPVAIIITQPYTVQTHFEHISKCKHSLNMICIWISYLVLICIIQLYLNQPQYPNMQADNFEIAENQQKLQYFSYIRDIMETKEINYWIGNPSVQIINGTIFLKPGIPVQTCQRIDSYEEYLIQYRKRLEEQIQEEDKMMGRTIVLIGIPNSKNPIEVCDRLGGYLEWIQQIRVIKTNHFKFYGMLLLLKNQQKSNKFFYDIFGEEYNSLEIQRVLVREMVEFSCVHTETAKTDNEQVFQHRKMSNMGSESSLQKMPAQEMFMKSSNTQNFKPNMTNSPRRKQNFKSLDSPKIKVQKQNDHSTCAICFEETEGTLISILCSHYFHVKCLSQWKQNICPLCRYHQQPPLIKFCEKCNQCEGLWVCLVCGVRLCCGFDHNILGEDSHIYQHYLETMHRLSMDVETKFIFDASQPAFLHQMLYKQVLKGDEGLEMQSQNSKKGKKTKLSQKISEYEQSISEEMQTQRMYFEDNINKQVKKRKDLIKEKKKLILEAEIEIAELDKQLQEAQQKKEEYQSGSVKYEKQLKVIGDVQKYWKSLSDKIKAENNQKAEYEKKQIRELDEMIALKKQQLKDFQRNKQLSAKIKSNVGKDQVQKTVILGTFGVGNKDPKKKKK